MIAAVFEMSRIIGFSVMVAGISINSYGIKPIHVAVLGLMLFLFGQYFAGAEQYRQKVIALEERQEMLNTFSECICSNEVCRECESFDKCIRHDPRAGCENEVPQ